MQQDKIPTNEIKRCPPHEKEMEVQQTLTVRDDRLDSVKYWLIVLVIAGHVFTCREFADSKACVVLGKWIYIFHMPLFIFISGFLSRKKDKKNFLPSIWRILEPLIIFQVLTIIPRILNKDFVNAFVIALTPWHMLWYLLSLVYYRLMLQFIPDKLLRHKKLILTCTFCISILAGFLPFDRFLSLQRTLAFMPFFFLGYYMRGKNLYLPNKYKPLCILFLILMFAIPLFFPQYLSLKHADPYGSVFVAVKRMITFVFAIPMSIAFINICYNTPWIAQQGKLTMQYYIYHMFMLLIVMVAVGMLKIPMSFATAVIITLGIIFGLGAILKLPYVKELTNPSLFFVKR